jgi:hypothetical protein
MHSPRYFSSLYAGVTTLTKGKDDACIGMGIACAGHRGNGSHWLVCLAESRPARKVPDKFHF